MPIDFNYPQICIYMQTDIDYFDGFFILNIHCEQQHLAINYCKFIHLNKKIYGSTTIRPFKN